MKSTPSSFSTGRNRAKSVAWSIGTGTRQGAQEADACVVPEDWQYHATAPLPISSPAPIPTH